MYFPHNKVADIRNCSMALRGNFLYQLQGGFTMPQVNLCGTIYANISMSLTTDQF